MRAEQLIGDWLVQAPLRETELSRDFLVRRGEDEAATLRLARQPLRDLLDVGDRFEPWLKIDHPNVLRLLEVGEHEGFLYLVLEEFDAPPWSDRFPLSFEKAREPFRQALEALIACHAQGVFHGHLVPELLLWREGQLKLSPPSLDQLSAVLVSDTQARVAYGAPERMLEAAPTAKSDQYALGAILYHALSGCPPFQDEDPLRLMHRVLTEDPPPCPGAPPFLARMLLREPEKRFANLRACRAEL